MPKVLKITSFRYHKKEGMDDVYFLHTDRHQTFLQVDTINSAGYGQSLPKYSK